MGRLGKKILYILGGIFTLIIAALLILPPLVIGKYKEQIITIVQEQTGRNVQIGDVSARLLPKAQVSLKNVIVPSVEGSANENLLTSESFHIRVALLPLLAKTLQIDVVELNNTKVYAEILPDGSNNWTMAFMEESGNSNTESKPKENTENKANSFDIKLGKAQLKQSEILFLNRKPGENMGMIQEIKNANIEAKAQNITEGPFSLKGDFMWNGLAFVLNGKTGKLTTEATPIDASVTIDGKHGFDFDGTILTQPHINMAGLVKLKSQNPAQLAQILTGQSMGLPHIAVSAQMELEASDKKGQVENGKLAIGQSEVALKADWDLGDIIKANVNLRGKNINLDEILASLSQAVPQSSAESSSLQTGSSSEPASPARLPENIEASLDVQVQNIIYNKEAISNAILQAKLEAGILHVPQISAILPGSSPIGANMVVKNGEASPYVDGNFSFKSPELKSLITWLGGDVSTLPQERLNHLDFRSNIAGGLEDIRLSNLDGKIDDMTIQGSLGAKLQGRLAILADLTINKLDTNPWMKAFAPKKAVKTSQKHTDILALKAYANTGAAQLIPLDADIKLNIGQLIYEDFIASQIQTHVNIKDDNLQIHNAAIGHIEGAQISANGQIFDLGGAQQAKDLTLSFKADSIASLLQKAQVKDIDGAKIGPVQLKTVLNGSLKGLISVNAAVQALGGQYNGAAQVNMAEWQAGNMNINQLNFQVKHNNLNQVTAVFSPETQIPSGFQSLDVGGQLQINDKIYQVNKFSGQIGQSQIKSANITANLAGAKPDIKLNLAAAMLNLDALQDGGKKAEQKKAQAASRKPGTPPWSDEKIDFSGLNALNMTADVTADNLRLSGKNLSNVKLNAVLKDGLLNVSSLSAGAYGGNLNASAQVNGNTPKIDASFKLASLNLNQLSKDMAGVKLPIGQLNMDSQVSMAGDTSRKLISSLNGKGSLKVAGLGAQQTGSEFDAFLALLQKVASIGQSGILDVDSQYSISNGIVNLSTMNISGPIGGKAKGQVNLPQWTLDINGAFTLLDGGASKLVLAALNKQSLTEEHPFRVYGSIDKPQMDLPSDLQKAFNLYKAANEKDIASLLANGVNANLLKKLGVSDKDSSLINGLIGGLGGTNKTSETQNKATNTQNKNPASSVTDKAVEEILGKDNPLNDAAKGLINQEAGKLFDKLF